MQQQPEVAIYSTPTCQYCAQAKRWFREHGVQYSEFDVSRDPNRASEMYRLTGQGSVPVIRVGGQVMVGFDPLQLARLLPSAKALGEAIGARVSLGMAAQSLTAERASEVGLPAPFGVVVGPIREGGPAALAGIQPGDVIVGIGSYTLQNLAQLQGIVGVRNPGDSLTLKVWRDGQEREVTVTFPAETPAPAGAAATS
ncbi:MAG TPA: Uxx-star family glutaredoxin-like (seleno)protein [Candidatus Dormibacteraeota bacterium]|jgi:glutaredoxin-like YruB-family protein|nr:Uxx-star family glutaredoxin-like (seleno)protein [Candidatus Dormibacteraeota bacterium]